MKKGLSEALVGAVNGFVLAAIIDAFAKDGLIPWYIQVMFTLIGILGSLLTVYGFKSVGILYIIGWIIGSWLLKDLFGPIDFMLMIVVPIVIILLRFWSEITDR